MGIIRKNEIYTVTIESYSSDASGVCRIAGRAVFVPRTIVGEVWEIRILKVSNSAVYARGEKLIKPSPFRQSPDCPHYGKCGGCDTRHMSYDEELRFKLRRVNDALIHIGKQSVGAEEIVGADSIYRYRNKGILALSQVEGKAQAGFYRQRSHDLIPISDCLIQNELCMRACAAVTGFMNERGIEAYDEASGKGIVRHIFCRKACYSDDAVLCIVSARGFGSLTDQFTRAIREACPELSGIVLNINKSLGNTVLSGDFYTLWGKAEICDSLCSIKYEIAPQAFYQINPPQAENLYMKALEYAAPTSDDLCLDMYCGAGTISLVLASKAGQVIGAEIVPEAIENARKNAVTNHMENVRFICADASQAALRFSEENLYPNIVVVDPPRKGMDKMAIEAIASMEPERIVYVSCNPATLARDIEVFSESGYQLSKVCAVDMFPGTCHVETVVLLSKGEIDSKKVRVEFSLEDMDMSDFQDKATYTQIKDYVLEHSGLKVSNLYISQIKRKCGLEVGKNYNLPKAEDSRQPQCPPEKENAIREAMKYFGMI